MRSIRRRRPRSRHCANTSLPFRGKSVSALLGEFLHDVFARRDRQILGGLLRGCTRWDALDHRVLTTDILIDGPNAYASTFAAIRAATDHIHIERFIFEDLDFNERLSDVLIAKQQAGVTVRVLYDSVGSLSTPREFLDRLHAAGIQLCEFNPVNPLRARLWRPNHRDHRKIVVVDGRVAFTGGINFHQIYRSGSAPLRMRSDAIARRRLA